MRSILITAVILIVILSASLKTKAQTSPAGEQTVKTIAALYNKEAYHDIYAMLAPSFRSMITEQQITSFFTNNLRKPFGNIVSWQPAKNKGAVINYTMQLDNGMLDLSFALNEKNEITTMQFLPAKKRTSTKTRDVATIPSNNPKQTKLQLLIDSIALDHLSDAANCGMSIGIIDGDRTDMYFYGSCNKNNSKLPGTQTLYEIGSVTKTFTAIILAHAINEGKINLDDDIRKYLPGQYPDLQYHGKPITIKNLSNHTSGLPRIPADLDKQPNYDDHDPYRNYSKEMMFSYLREVKIKGEPGTVNEYSNFAVALLGVILEQVYGQSYLELVNKYIMAPAHMSDTKITLTPGELARTATGYAGNGAETPYWNMGASVACGGLRSSLPDMLKYLAANMKEINADFTLPHVQTYKDPNIALGLNWIITTTKNGNTLTWHNGATAGFTSFCGYIREKKAGVVILNNSGNDIDEQALNILKEMNK